MNPPTKVVKPHAEILDPERGRDYIPIQAGPDPSKEEHKHPEAKAVVPSELSWARVEQTSAKTWCTRIALAFIGMVTLKFNFCTGRCCKSLLKSLSADIVRRCAVSRASLHAA